MGDRKSIVLKIGGSVISDKEQRELSINSEIIQRIADELKALIDEFRFYLVHGVGNAGHPPVKEYNLHKRFEDQGQLLGFTIAQNRVNKLRNELLEALERRNIPAIAFYPSSIIESEDRRIENVYSRPMEEIVEKGAIPVLSGDLIHDEERGLAVCSGDVLVFELARIFDVKKILFGVNIEGVYSGPPQQPSSHVIEEISMKNLPNILQTAGNATGIDVSGGMEGKLKVMLEYNEFFDKGGEVALFNLEKPSNLRKILCDPSGHTFTRITQ